MGLYVGVLGINGSISYEEAAWAPFEGGSHKQHHAGLVSSEIARDTSSNTKLQRILIVF